jgi:uncharacterized protein (DUF58 family)
MDTKELLARVRKIEIKTKGLSKQLFAGEYHSAFKGRGMSFSEVRDYQYGDNIRDIDWNVSARFGKPFVKIFEEERELTMMLLIDVSPSSFTGSNHELKNRIITEIGAVLSFSAMQNNDKVGAIFFSETVEKYIPPKKGKSHVLRIIREMISFEPEGKQTNIASALEYLNSMQKKRAIVFILSDFRDHGYYKALSLASKRHDLVGLRIRDRSDYELPKLGLIKTRDPETGRMQWLNTYSPWVQKKYRAQDESYTSYFKQQFLKTGTDSMEVSSTESYVKSLMKFFKSR